MKLKQHIPKFDTFDIVAIMIVVILMTVTLTLAHINIMQIEPINNNIENQIQTYNKYHKIGETNVNRNYVSPLRNHNDRMAVKR